MDALTVNGVPSWIINVIIAIGMVNYLLQYVGVAVCLTSLKLFVA